LHFGTKTATGSLADGIHAMKIYDGSVTIDSTIVLPNLYTGTSDTSLVISNDTVYKKVNPIIESGTYTPTITDSLNIDGVSTISGKYSRIGNSVDVWIKIFINCTSINSESIIGISLPISSNFDATTDVFGVGHHFLTTEAITINASSRSGEVYADLGGDKAYFVFSPSTAASAYALINFTYEIK